MVERLQDHARYSKVTRRMWLDEKFRALSAPPPNARDCWIRLLTAPEQGPIPGLFHAWSAGIAQSLGWETEAFGEALTEVLAKGLAKVDERVGLWWLPNAIKHNAPESPNVVRGWRRAWVELPDSPLKAEAEQALLACMRERGIAWEKAFFEATGRLPPSPSSNPSGTAKPARRPRAPKGQPKASAKASPKPSPNQEQEHDHDLDPKDATIPLKTCQVSSEQRALEPVALRRPVHRRSERAPQAPVAIELDAPRGDDSEPRASLAEPTRFRANAPSDDQTPMEQEKLHDGPAMDQEGPLPVFRPEMRAPASLSEALALPAPERAASLERDPHRAQWLEPQRWPEVVEVARAWGPVRLGAYHRDAGVRAIVGLLAAGYSVPELVRVSASLQRSPWAQQQREAGRRIGMATLTPEVVRRELEAMGPEQVSLVELVRARRREERRKGAVNVG